MQSGNGRTKQIPIEFKVLASLRILGRDYYADDVAEILNCGEETARSFMLAFIRGVSKKMYSTHVYVPEGEELDSVKEGYRRVGLPGCVGSMDCTHVLWDCTHRRRLPISESRVVVPKLCRLRLW